MSELGSATFVLGSEKLGSGATALALVRRAAEAGISQFEAAHACSDSEDRLGEALAGKKAIRTITMLGPLSELSRDASHNDVRAAVDRSIEESLVALRRNRLDCLMLHRAGHMQAYGGAIWERLIERLEDGSVLSLGVSVQSPLEALAALACRDVVHLQLPFNLLDWRWRKSGFRACLGARPGVTVHGRNVWLYGILAGASVWPRIDGVHPQAIMRMLANLVHQLGREGPADLCLAYARGQDWIDGVVVGLETEDQLDDNLRLFVKRPLDPDECTFVEGRLPHLPIRLFDPAQWPNA